MRWGKVIDHDRCIGCHACSVACKSENGVPLGSFRTWVKSVEKGTFPEVRRHFAVLRCNQCDHAPCTRICPTAAMYRRPDGIVDFDNEVCIGCKGCIQACPYDAIYMDPESHTAAKCHFCAHRVEIGLEPACVTACPERALLVGDLDDPLSQVSQIVARAGVRVRKPELGTRPKVFYKGVDEVLLQPDAAVRPRETMWGQGRELPLYHAPGAAESGLPQAPTAPNVRAAQAIVTYDVPRDQAPWGGKISAYLVTKGIGAGALMVGGVLALLGGPLNPVPAVLALVFLAITTALLVLDLKRPERFLLVLTRPQWGSWLVRGTFCLIAATLVSLAWLALRYLAPADGPSRGEVVAIGLLAILSSAAAAGYTAFLFGQARGRAFWQSSLLLPHLVIQAFAAGAASLIVLAPLFAMAEGPAFARAGGQTKLEDLLTMLLMGSLALDALAVASEIFSHVGPEDARQAARSLYRGRLRDAFWVGVVVPRAAALVVLALHLGGDRIPTDEPLLPLAPLGAAFALVGLAAWDHLYVIAGQEPPLS